MSMLGVALANFIPQNWGLGFAGVLSLVAIVCSMATTRLRVLAALIAGVPIALSSRRVYAQQGGARRHIGVLLVGFSLDSQEAQAFRRGLHRHAG